MDTTKDKISEEIIDKQLKKIIMNLSITVDSPQEEKCKEDKENKGFVTKRKKTVSIWK